MKNELAYFTDTVNRLIEGKLILVDKNIASVLKCVANVPALYKCLSDSLRSISYVTEFSRAKVSWTRPDGTVEARLKLPAERNRIFAFVVCLLTEVDSGRRNFLDFLKEYYDETDSNRGYEKFVNEVLRPFKRAGESILQSVDPDSVNAEWSSSAERFFDVEKTYISSATSSALLQQVQQVVNLFYAEGDSAQKHYDTIMLVCEYFTNALRLKNPKILCICWIALKSILEMYHFAQECLQNMTALMAQISL